MAPKGIKRINVNFTVEIDLSNPEAMANFKAKAGDAETFRDAAAFFQMDAAEYVANEMEVDMSSVRIVASQRRPW